MNGILCIFTEWIIASNLNVFKPIEGFPGGPVVKNLPEMQERQVWSLGQEDPLEKEMAMQLWYFLPGKSHEQRSWVGHSPWDHNSWKQLSDYWVLGQLVIENVKDLFLCSKHKVRNYQWKNIGLDIYLWKD